MSHNCDVPAALPLARILPSRLNATELTSPVCPVKEEPTCWSVATFHNRTFVLAAMFTPWTYLVFAVGIGLVIALLKTGRVPKPAAWLLSALVTGLAAVAVILNLYTVWVPHEIVHFPPGTLKPEPQVGYVLSEDNGWITMLTSGPHQIVRYPDAKVVTQMVCERHPRPGDFWSEVKDGATLWDEVTAHEPDLHPAYNQDCSD